MNAATCLEPCSLTNGCFQGGGGLTYGACDEGRDGELAGALQRNVDDGALAEELLVLFRHRWADESLKAADGVVWDFSLLLELHWLEPSIYNHSEHAVRQIFSNRVPHGALGAHKTAVRIQSLGVLEGLHDTQAYESISLEMRAVGSVEQQARVLTSFGMAVTSAASESCLQLSMGTITLEHNCYRADMRNFSSSSDGFSDESCFQTLAPDWHRAGVVSRTMQRLSELSYEA